HGPRQVLDHRNLTLQGLGRFLALSLVFRVQRQPVLRSTEVKEHERGIGVHLVLEPPERLDPAVQSAGRKSVRARQLWHPKKRPKRHVEPVDQHPFRHEPTQDLTSRQVNKFRPLTAEKQPFRSDIFTRRTQPFRWITY